MKPLPACLVVASLVCVSGPAAADAPVVLEPLEAVDAEFESIKPAAPDVSGWGVLGVSPTKLAELRVTPTEASEWWDGQVLDLPPRAAVAHRIESPMQAGQRFLVCANLRLADADAEQGRIVAHMLGRSEVMNRTTSAKPVMVDGAWRRAFMEIDLGPNWPADAKPSLQIVNIGGSNILIDKVSIARITTDEAGFRPLFDGASLAGWTGNTEGYGVENGAIRTYPERAGGNLYTTDEFGDFVFRFAFKVPPGANNGIAIRAPLGGDAAYEGMEVQVLENSHPKYAGLKPWQFHGSIYGLAPALRGYLAPPGEWNHEEIRAEGRKIRVILNGKVINEVDLDKALEGETLSGREHPGAKRLSGHIGFCGHGDVVHFTDLRVRPLE